MTCYRDFYVILIDRSPYLRDSDAADVQDI